MPPDLAAIRAVLADHEWCGANGDCEGIMDPYCMSCEAEMPRSTATGRSFPPWPDAAAERAAYDAAHAPGCAWMQAMGRR